MVIIEGITKETLSYFEELLKRASDSIVEEYGHKLTEVSPSDFEKIVFKSIKTFQEDYSFISKIELISGTRFPDIVCRLRESGCIGVEVKSTKSDKWECIGNSINESSRLEDVKNIYVMFGKLGGSPSVSFAKYEDVLLDVRITHFPRYYIKMDIAAGDTIFKKMGVEYNYFRADEQKFKVLKNYYRQNLKEGEELWWLDENSEKNINVIRLWNEVSESEKDEVLSDAFILFTELFQPRSGKKYNRLASWLVASHQIVSPSLRDSFSAGGKEIISGYEFPRVAKTLIDHIDTTSKRLASIDKDDLSHYWKMRPASIPTERRHLFDTWLTRVMNHMAQDLDLARLNIFRKEVVGRWLKGFE